MTVHEVLSRLQGVKKSGDGWVARCVGHEDRSPSLSVKEGNDGAVLLNCFSGCTIDAICAGLQIEPKDLFPQNGNGHSPKREIVTTYDYKDLDGTLLFQAVRYSPKGFSQRAPDGNGGWKYSLNGVKRVLYRLPELKGRDAIVIGEGEKDIDAAWALDIPATCNPMGAGKWLEEYTVQLVAAGVKRVALVPDNDPPGRAHVEQIARSLRKAGLGVRIVTLPDVPEHGDLSDYLAAHSKAEFLALLKETPTIQTPPPARPDHDFQVLGEQRYTFTVHSAGIYFELDRLRRSSHELWGELLVKVNGNFAHARTFDQGVLQVGDLNLSSVQARSTRGKLIAERAGDKETDWYGFLEEFCQRVIAADREGAADVDLRDVPKPGPDRWMTIDGIELPIKHPTVLFGDGGSAKSYFALYWAGRMVESGLNVLYVDWEWTDEEHRERIELLFGPMFPRVRHLGVYRSLRDERERVQRVIRTRNIQYLVFDSVALACGGDPSASEACTTYWQTVRQFGIGSLHIAHVTKGFNGKSDDQKPFGSAFWHNMARATFNVKGEPMGTGAIGVGVYGRKSQWGRQTAAAFKLQFENTRTSITPVELKSVAGLEDGLPLIDRILNAVTDDPKTRKELSEILGVDVGTIQRVVYRELKRGHLTELPGRKGQTRLAPPATLDF